MNNIIYRQVRKSDYNDIKLMIDDAWQFDRYSNDPKSKDHLLKAFIYYTLVYQNYNEVAELNGKVIGLLYGKIQKKGYLIKNLKYLPSTLYHILCPFLKSKNERSAVKGFFEMQDAYKKLYKNTDEEFGAKLELFVVHNKFQGIGIGKQLLNNYLKYLKDIDIKKMYLFTDTNCNYGFYDHDNFVKRGCLPMYFNLYDGKFEFDVYMYSKNIE